MGVRCKRRTTDKADTNRQETGIKNVNLRP